MTKKRSQKQVSSASEVDQSDRRRTPHCSGGLMHVRQMRSVCHVMMMQFPGVGFRVRLLGNAGNGWVGGVGVYKIVFLR